MLLACVLILVSSPVSRAEDDGAVIDPKRKTVQILTDPKQRAEAIANDPKAQFADRQVQALGNSEAIYGLSGEIFEELVEKTGGDSVKLAALMEKAKTDPKGFAESLSPELQAKLKSVSKETQDRGAAGAAPKAP